MSRSHWRFDRTCDARGVVAEVLGLRYNDLTGLDELGAIGDGLKCLLSMVHQSGSERLRCRARTAAPGYENVMPVPAGAASFRLIFSNSALIARASWPDEARVLDSARAPHDGDDVRRRVAVVQLGAGLFAEIRQARYYDDQGSYIGHTSLDCVGARDAGVMAGYAGQIARLAPDVALAMGTAEGNASMVVKALRQGADRAMARFGNGYSAIERACQYQHYGVVDAMLAEGIKSSLAAFTGLLEQAPDDVDYGRQREIAMRLLVAGLDVNGIDSNGCRPVHIATRNDRAAIIRDLVALGADVNAAVAKADGVMFGVPQGATPLHLAASLGRCEALCALLECGADIGAHDAAGKTAMELAKPEAMAVLRAFEARAAAGRAVECVMPAP